MSYAEERGKYARYCLEHLDEFRDELRDEANRVVSGWPGRVIALLLAISSVLTFVDATNRGNPLAPYALLAYAIPILVIICYPLLTLAWSKLAKWAPYVYDIVCLTGILGYVISLEIVFAPATTPEQLESLFSSQSGQVNFLLLIAMTFAFHPLYRTTFLRNLLLLAMLTIGLYTVNSQFFILNQIQVVQGFMIGTVMGWIFYESVRTRFFVKSTDANTRQHLYNQLSKLVYPHQLERIKLGDELESTMPLKEGKAVVNVFDVQRSSEIKHERTAEFFMELFQSFLEICMAGYEHNPLRSQAFRLKETGDGFISSVGYPFLPVDSRSLADSAVSTALTMFEAFNMEVEKFNYSRPIKAAMGIAYNSVQGTFQSGGIRSYDLFGEALIQASKYEELRKQPQIWNIFSRYAADKGLEHFNIMIVQEVVYNSLSPAYRDLFAEIDLRDDELVRSDFQMMYDNDARYIYFHILA